MNKVKLSQLDDSVFVSIEDSNLIYTVEELVHEIRELGEPHHETTKWYTVKKQHWSPWAARMVELYLENECQDMYDGWVDRAMDCCTVEVVDKIQAIMDKAFKGDYATLYWTYETPVEIDIYPPQKG